MAGPAPVGNTAGREKNPLDNVPRFLEEIEDAGFSWQEGDFGFLDFITEVCEGDIISAMGNNPWPNAYFVLQMKNPEDAGYPLPYTPMWQMEQDEAIVIIGQTPPTVRYFGIQSWVQLGPASVINYELPVTANRTLIGSGVGDTTNNLTVHTIDSDHFKGR